MTTEPELLDLDRVLTVLRRRWWVIGLLTLFLAGAALAFSLGQTKQYTATASVLFQNPQLQQQASGLQVIPTSPTEDQTIMATNIQLLTQQAGVTETTAKGVGHGLTAGAVGRAITVAQKGQTSVANVSATSTDPRLAAAIANGYVSNFISIQQAQQKAQVAQALNLVEQQISALSRQQLAGVNGQALLDRAESLRILARLQDGGAQLVSTAKVPTSPSSPKTKRNTVFGVLLGLLLGLTAAFLLERFDKRMKTTEDLERTYQVPLLATVPQSRAFAETRQTGAASHHPEQEVFRMLRIYLRYFNVDRDIKTVLVISAAPGDGKTTVARNLAEAAQETGAKTLLIDADMRRPDIATYYALPPAPGLSEVLSGSSDTGKSIHSVPIATRVNGSASELSLDILTAGHCPPNPAELVESKAMTTCLSWAAEHYDLVVIDTPPLTVVSDALPLLTKVDGVVLVAKLGKNTRDAASFLRERLAGVNAPLLGVVANGAGSGDKGGYGYGNGYYGQSNAKGAVQPIRDSSATR